jgi:hypothetical protein
VGVRYQRAADLVELTGILQTTATGLTIDEISDRFEVSRRTAERMLGALRARFPELCPDLRSGRKYWKLPAYGHARAIQLPRTVDALSERIKQLEAEVAASRSEIAGLRSLSDGVISTAAIGLMVLDPDLRVVCTNPTLSKLFCVDTARFIGLDIETVVKRELAGVIEAPDRVAAQLRSDTSTSGEDFDCHVLPGGGRPERWVRHWSRPIEHGAYAGGRIDRWLDVTAGIQARRARTPMLAPAESPLPETGAPILREHLTLVQEATADFLEQHDLPQAVRNRLDVLAQSNTITIESSVELVEAGGIKMEKMSPREVLEVARRLVQRYADERKVRLELDADPGLPPMCGDRALAISNVVMNVKLTLEAVPSDSHITLRAVRLGDPDRVRVSVLDRGPTLPPDFPGLAGGYFRTRAGVAFGIGIRPARDADGREVGIEQYYELPVV